jgi:hypothetical protein
MVPSDKPDVSDKEYRSCGTESDPHERVYVFSNERIFDLSSVPNVACTAPFSILHQRSGSIIELVNIWHIWLSMESDYRATMFILNLV